MQLALPLVFLLFSAAFAATASTSGKPSASAKATADKTVDKSAPKQQPARTPDIHFTPTRHNIADAMLQLAGVGPDDVVYDLGSGDGRIPIIAAQKYGARGVGIEIDPKLVELSWRIANEAEVAHRVSFIVGDLFTADLSKATVVTTYLSQSIMKLLEPKLRALAPGTRIVGHHFPMVGWPPDRRIKVDEAEIMLWVVK